MISRKNYVDYPKSYSEIIPLNFGEMLSLKSNELGFMYDVLNNIPTISFNYDYGVHESFSLLSIIFNSSLVHQGVDIAFNNLEFKKIQGDSTDIMLDKKKLLNSIMSGRKDNIIEVTTPKIIVKGKNRNIDKCLEFDEELQYTIEVIRRSFHINAERILSNVIKALYNE